MVRGGLVRDPIGGKKEEYRVVSIKKTGILKKVRRGIGAWKEAVMVIVVVGGGGGGYGGQGSVERGV